MNTLQQQLEKLGACPAIVLWAADYNDSLDAWRACPRGDWLLWLAARIGVQREALVFAGAACARLTLPFAKNSLPLAAIELAEQWAAGERPSMLLRRMGHVVEALLSPTSGNIQALIESVQSPFCGDPRATAAARAAITVAEAAYTARAAGTVYRAALEAADIEAVGDENDVSPLKTAMYTPDAMYAVTLRKCADLVREKIDEATVLEAWQNVAAV